MSDRAGILTPPSQFGLCHSSCRHHRSYARRLGIARVAGRRPIPAVLDDHLLVADDADLVQEPSIISDIRMLLDHAGLVVEPSAALGIAAILDDRDRFAGRHVITVCGSKVDTDPYHRWVGRGSHPQVLTLLGRTDRLSPVTAGESRRRRHADTSTQSVHQQYLCWCRRRRR